ncbi:MAG: N-acetylmuramoyl-L-alanine amidase [Limisphaerales bacterium]
MFRPGIPLLFVAAALLFAGCAPLSRPGKGQPPDVDLTPAPAVVSPPTVAVPVPFPVPPPAAPVLPVVPAETWLELGAWAASNQLGPLTRLTAGNGQNAAQFSLATPRGQFAFKADSELARWNGLEIRLGFPPQARNGSLWLHRLDVEKNLLPLLAEPWMPPNGGRRVIVVDAGHGGSDSGTRSPVPGRLEKHYTLDWAQRLKPLLEAQGWQVVMTRTNDADVSLPARVAIAEAAGADLFLSLHFNSANGNGHAGIETYCLTPFGMPSNLARGYEDNTALTFPNNRFDAANLQLAVRLHRELLAATGAPDRGVRRARFMTVLRGQNRPAVLLEAGYLSNPAEAERIHQPEYRQRLAEAVARGVGGLKRGD